MTVRQHAGAQEKYGTVLMVVVQLKSQVNSKLGINV